MNQLSIRLVSPLFKTNHKTDMELISVCSKSLTKTDTPLQTISDIYFQVWLVCRGVSDWPELTVYIFGSKILLHDDVITISKIPLLFRYVAFHQDAERGLEHDHP